VSSKQVQAGQGAADGGLGRHRPVIGASRRAPNAARIGRGASVAHSPTAASERAPVKTAAAVMARIATSGWRRPPGASRVRDGGQIAQQVRGFGWLQGIGVGELGEGRWEGG
jgi:hypothetical protein